jgi:NADPH-dependent 2,4-dienoyl-CoA reductase/sulfur reductase-like enzyme
VVLAEKNDKLGGILTFTDYDNVKEDLRRYKNYLITKVNSLNIEVKFNTEVTPDYVEQENPDSLIVAVGSEPVIPKIPGIENPHVKHALEIYKELKNTGDAIGKKVSDSKEPENL